ncbi:hypothetical protein JAAARDRAFT_147517 [Jaapia argillacea MUCL 33604]|uniref:Uncharacterized protein n=1 Tax=Jaapia argillacea MUCL 33604 TaxID=933084 RepID=A0A067Q8E9_9AGAM|nr:hypothetical protein JAAARDRAFT_147517 [Jaapia argillacea MUCL 33604]
MSFQHFRLDVAHAGPYTGPSHASHLDPTSLSSSSSLSQANIDPILRTHQEFQLQMDATSGDPQKPPYGSGDADDGYTMVFESLHAFQAWRAKEEEEKMVEFVKGDTHGSKAVPPRFKDHTKLVCARHQRSGRKKYVKKHPDRVRKVPSRKIEVGCHASISYKTYFETEEVRVCYNSQHSHEIGLPNLPFTRRGRKAQLQWEKDHKGRRGRPPKSASAPHEDGSEDSPPSPFDPSFDGQPFAGPSYSPPAHVPPAPRPTRSRPPPPPPSHQSHLSLQNAVSMIAPLPQVSPHSLPMSPDLAGRWERMGTLFDSIRDHANTFQYPEASVDALESVLIRLYLESPLVATSSFMNYAGPSLSAPPHLPSQVNGMIGPNGDQDMEEEEEEDME